MKKLCLMLCMAIMTTAQANAQSLRIFFNDMHGGSFPSKTINVTFNVYNDPTCTVVGTSNPIPITITPGGMTPLFYTSTALASPSFWIGGSVPVITNYTWDVTNLRSPCGMYSTGGTTCPNLNVTALFQGSCVIPNNLSDCFEIDASGACSGLSIGDNFNASISTGATPSDMILTINYN